VRGWKWIGLVGLIAALAVNALVPPLVVSALSVPELGALRPLGAWGWLPALVMAQSVCALWQLSYRPPALLPSSFTRL